MTGSEKLSHHFDNQTYFQDTGLAKRQSLALRAQRHGYGGMCRPLPADRLRSEEISQFSKIQQVRRQASPGASKLPIRWKHGCIA